MKKLLNTLYIYTQGSYLSKDRETIIIKNGKEKIGQFPAINITGIFCFGRISISPPLMGYCAERGIAIVFFTIYGRFQARVQGKVTGNVLLRREQYRRADDANYSLDVARLMVAAKIANTRYILQREIRNHGDNIVLDRIVRRLAFSLDNLRLASSCAEVMGIEGEAANSYFAIFDQLIRDKDLVFSGRVRRPPTDPVNAMLSFVYTLLTQECASALTGVGLDPYVGFLHRDRSGRVSLALDLLEEFRSAWADRLVLTLINRKQIQPKEFITESSGAVRFTPQAKKDFINAYQAKKQTEIIHPYLKEKIPLGLLPHCQALLLARHIRNELKHYPPYLAR